MFIIASSSVGAFVFDRKHQRSNEHRELSLLAYLSHLQPPDPGPVRPLHSLTPYQVHDIHDAAVVFLMGQFDQFLIINLGKL